MSHEGEGAMAGVQVMCVRMNTFLSIEAGLTWREDRTVRQESKMGPRFWLE